jgi:hypothetical protein
MKLRNGLGFLELLVALFLAAGPVGAQQPIVGGHLFVASPGPVQTTFLGASPATLESWVLVTGWSTGPGAFDYAEAQNPFFANVPPPKGSGDSNASSGSTHSTPALAANTLVFVLGDWHRLGIFDTVLNYERDHTGLLPLFKDFGRSAHFASAVVFPGPNNTAQIGIPPSTSLGISRPAFTWTTILDFPIQILVSNVCVQ